MLAEPYLRNYRPVRQSSGPLRGFWFLAPDARPAPKARKPASRRADSSVGFFAGYLLRRKGFEYLSPVAPECLVFAFVQPVGGRAHRQLVRAPDSPLRWTFNYIRYLTHRPPRFEFYDRQLAAMVRHHPILPWPAARRLLLARNFFIETLAWLVRSGLVRKFAGTRRAARTPRSS